MVLLFLACTPSIDPLNITVSVQTDARNAGLPLQVVVGNADLEVARAPFAGDRLTLSLPPPESHEAEVYVGVVDADGWWRGVAGNWLRSCTRFCDVDTPETASSWEWYGWNEVEEVWEQGTIPTGARPSLGYAFEVYANDHARDPLTIAVEGGVDVTGLRRAVLAMDAGSLETAAFAEAPVDSPTITVGPDAPAAAWVQPRLSSWEGTDLYVDAAVARVVAYADRDGSGGWSAGDGIAAEACLDGAGVSVAWVAPTRDPYGSWHLMWLTGYDTGWTLATARNGEFSLLQEDLAWVRWCAWSG